MAKIVKRIFSRNRKPTHPGDILWEEFFIPSGLSIKQFAKRLGVTLGRLYDLKKGSPINVDMAIRLALFFNTSVEYWLNLQKNYDIHLAENKNWRIYKRVKRERFEPKEILEERDVR